jgi:Ca2+-binding RTX toxin-like protein
MARSTKTRNAFRPQVEAFEDRLTPASLNFNAGNLLYNAGIGVANNLSISRMVVNNVQVFRIIDSAETITVTGVNGATSGGASGSGTNAVNIPAARVTGSITAALTGGNDVVTVNSTSRPVTVNMGNGNDRLRVGTGSITSAVSVNGQNDQDWLDYSLWGASVAATVNGTGTRVGAMTGMENIRGGGGADFLTGDGLANILMGGHGSDTLNGAGGKDVLIGGTSADTLRGGVGEDLLIGGTTSHDGNLTSMQAIKAEWDRTLDYGLRIGNLRNGGGLNGLVRLNSTTVFADASTDTMIGGTDLRDWFWGTRAEASDEAANEQFN